MLRLITVYRIGAGPYRPARCKIVAPVAFCSARVTCGICRGHGKRDRVFPPPLGRRLRRRPQLPQARRLRDQELRVRCPKLRQGETMKPLTVATLRGVINIAGTGDHNRPELVITISGLRT